MNCDESWKNRTPCRGIVEEEEERERERVFQRQKKGKKKDGLVGGYAMVQQRENKRTTT